MALQILNLLVVNVPSGRISCDLEYNDQTAAVTRLFGTNASNTNFLVAVTLNSTGQTFNVNLRAQSSPSVTVPNGLLSVVLTEDDVIPPISVSGGGALARPSFALAARADQGSLRKLIRWIRKQLRRHDK